MQGSTTALAAVALGRRPRQLTRAPGLGHARAGLPETVWGRVDPALLKQLALTAVDAAKTAGVTYADVRLTRTIAGFDETLGVGVRCLVNGYWGFAASAVWTPDEMRALAQSAAARAKADAKGPPRPVDWQPLPAVSGDWRPHFEIDPFTITIEEGGDFGGSMAGDARPARLYMDRVWRYKREHGHAPPDELGLALQLIGAKHGGAGGATGWPPPGGAASWRQEQAIATSDGTYVTQTLCDSWFGWEVNRDAAARLERWLDAVWPEAIALAEELASLPVKAVELGRYDLVLDGGVSASLVGATFGVATQLDRALGYEANAGGTSYLGPDPLALLGSLPVASEHVTVTANRSMPNGRATVKWDLEGATPEEATLVKQGVLVDYQTTREQAGWLAPYYQKVGKPVRGHGYAAAPTALEEPIQHMPNLVLEPGTPGTPVAEMIKGVKKGIYCLVGAASTDFQAKTGTLTVENPGGICREIVNGKLGARLAGFTVPFRSLDLWKAVRAVGPAAEAVAQASGDTKGQPIQSAGCTVQGVPLWIPNQPVLRT